MAHVTALIVEVEAYLGLDDPASHAFRGPTPRSAIMFRRPGHLYVYLSYGVHFCANVVTEAAGTAGAVLLRAASAQSGDDVVVARRGARRPADLLRGPGNLCRGLGLTLADNDLDLCSARSRLRVLPRERHPSPSIDSGPRVGITVAAERPLRFVLAGHPAVSARAGRRAAAQPEKEEGPDLAGPS